MFGLWCRSERTVMSIEQLVQAELARAVAKFPTWPTDPLHALAVLGEEFGELTKAMLQHTYEPHKGVTAQDIRDANAEITGGASGPG
jgi:NTP pyrophosphatase (non-canonical NTP hydrolase)